MVRAVALALGAGPLSALGQGAANEAPAAPPPPPPDPSAPRPRLRFGRGTKAIGLLLPRQDGAFARASTALLAGVRAAHGVDGDDAAVEAIEIDDQADQIASAIAGLHERNFAFVIGPVTRTGATALVDLGAVGLPALALNLPDADAPVSTKLAFFGLATEGEARQVATQAFAQALARAGTRAPRAVAVMSDSPLSKRSAAAFVEAWRRLGGATAEPIEFAGARPPRDLRARLGRPAPDVAFLAMGAESARVLRAAFGAEVAVWSTSLASVGGGGTLRLPELDGLRVLEMPWQLQPDHAAVMAYPRPAAGFNLEMQRLYALGIDAWRLARRMLVDDAPFELDGVTGRLTFDRAASPRVERTALVAEYRNGVPVAADR